MLSNVRIAVVDDDDSVRRAVERLLRARGFAVTAFASVDEFLGSSDGDLPACAIVDVRMPGKTGLDLFASIVASGADVGIIFITGDGDLPVAARTSRGGAVGFLAKPFDEQALVSAIDQCLRSLEARRATRHN